MFDMSGKNVAGLRAAIGRHWGADIARTVSHAGATLGCRHTAGAA